MPCIRRLRTHVSTESRPPRSCRKYSQLTSFLIGQLNHTLQPFLSRNFFLRQIVGDAFNVSPKRTKLPHDRLVTAIDVINTVDKCLATCAECGQDERRRCTQIRGEYWSTREPPRSTHGRGVARD